MRFGFRQYFQRRHSLKWHMTLLLLIAGSVGFVCSRLLLANGVDNVLGRYPLAVLAGYTTFLLCLRIWLQWLRWQYSDAELSQFEIEPAARAGKANEKNSFWDNFDLPVEGDELGCLIIAVFLLLFALIGGGVWLISDAALLLTDIAVQFLFTGWLTRRIRHMPNQHWFQAAVAATFWPFLWSTVAAVLLGIVIRVSCPGAESLPAAFAAECRT